MTLTKPQRKSLHGKWLQDNQGMSYRDFRRTVHPELGSYDVLVVKWRGMFLGIETDGCIIRCSPAQKEILLARWDND